jgi:hypothetical protein
MGNNDRSNTGNNMNQGSGQRQEGQGKDTGKTQQQGQGKQQDDRNMSGQDKSQDKSAGSSSPSRNDDQSNR